MPAKPRKAAAKPLPPFRVEVSEGDYLLLVKHARRQSNVARRLATAEQPAKNGTYVLTGSTADALGLRALALAHAPKAVPAIDRALKAGQDKGK
jgi:hypothetical protein